MTVEALSPELASLIDPSAKVEHLAGGFQFTEGPLWNAGGGFLLFSDIPNNRIHQWTPDGQVSVQREPSGKSNGLAYDGQERLVACEHANRRVSRTEADGTVQVLADRFDGKRLNSPNDVIVKSDGTIYFTDPPYGLTKEYGEEGEQELEFQGVFRLAPDSGKLSLVNGDFRRPNGLCFSPDESLLYVNDTERMHIRVFEAGSNGALSGGDVFATLEGENGAPDGMKVDAAGNLFCTGPGGVWIFNPAGDLLGKIRIDEPHTANLAWGGDDFGDLFITACTNVYRVMTRTTGNVRNKV